jgi:O-antigen/teichoic acid export membrane protein
MLKIQVWALVPLSIGSVLSIALLALRRQRAIAIANGIALLVVLGLGWVLIDRYQGEGAAVAGLVAECGILLVLVAMIARTNRGLLPRVSFLPRPLIALAAGLATLLVHLPPWIDGAVAGVVFIGVALAVGAVPSEVAAALRRRAPGDLP